MGSITRRGSSNRKAGVVDYEYGGSEMDEHEKSEAVKATVTLDNPGKKPFIMTREFWHDWMPGWVPICLAILSAVTGGSWWAAQDHTSITRDVQDLKNGQAEQKIVLDTMRKDQSAFSCSGCTFPTMTTASQSITPCRRNRPHRCPRLIPKLKIHSS